MTHPGSPQADPSEGYGHRDAYPPAAGYPAGSFGEQPRYDQSVTPLPAGGEGYHSLDPSMSTAPMQQPASLLSAPPNMGPPPNIGRPMSGAPTSGFPGRPIGYPAAEPPKQRGVAVPLLATFLALAIIVAGVFVGLWIDKSDKLDASDTRSNQRQAALDQSNLDLEQTRTGLKAKADELTKAQEELCGTVAERAELKRQRDVIGSCLKLLLEALDAAAAGDKTTMQKKINEMKAPCNEAEVILGL